MKRRQSLLVFFSAILIAGTYVAARADDGDQYDRTFSIGPRATYFKAKDADKGEWSGGAQARIWANKSLGFEGSVDYRRETFGSPIGDTRVHIYPVQASILASLIPNSPVNLFLLGGAGWYYTKIDRPDPLADKTDDRFGLHAGAGVEFRLGRHWSLDGTYRYVWLEKLKSEDARLQDKEFDDKGSQVTTALNYNF